MKRLIAAAAAFLLTAAPGYAQVGTITARAQGNEPFTGGFMNGANGAGWVEGTSTFTITADGSTSYLSPAGTLPAGSLIWAITTRVTTTFSGGLVATFSVGDNSSGGDRFCATAGGITAGSTRVCLDHFDSNVAGVFAAQNSADEVSIDFGAGAPTAGVMRVVVFYRTFTPPAS